MNRHRVLITSSFVVLGLSGCVTAENDARDAYTKTSLSGQEIFIYHDTEVNPDCSNAGMPVVKAVAGPSHGSVRIIQSKVYPNFSRDNMRYKCNAKAVDGIKVLYTSDKGFKGRDKVTISGHTSTGNAHLTTVDIKVE